MRSRLIIIIALLSFCLGAHAQKRNNFVIGASPFGQVHINMKKDDEKYKYDYKNYLSGGLQYENSHHGITSLTELNYFRANYDKSDLQGISTEHFNPVCTENIFGASLTQYIGVVINPKGSVQLPIYLGLGADYLNNSAFLHHFTGDIAAKARLKIFFDKIGVYVGGSGRAGFGVKGGSEHQGYNITTMLWSVDAGLIIGI